MLREDALAGKTIIVTGGGTGLGKSMAKYFLELGANVIICSRRLAVLETTAKELSEATGGQVLPVECDVRKPEQIEAARTATMARFGAVHGWVNDSAGNVSRPTERRSYKAIDTAVYNV